MNRWSLFSSLYLFHVFLMTSAVSHSLEYRYKAYTFRSPDFMADAYLDGEKIHHYDSGSKKLISTSEWFQRTDDEPYWKKQEESMWANEENLKYFLHFTMIFDHQYGRPVMERIYGCELDDDRTVRGYERYIYEGQEVISLDLKTRSWTAADEHAIAAKHYIKRRGYTQDRLDYLEHTCISQLKKFLFYKEVSVYLKVDVPEITSTDLPEAPKNIKWSIAAPAIGVGVSLFFSGILCCGLLGLSAKSRRNQTNHSGRQPKGTELRNLNTNRNLKDDANEDQPNVITSV